ncbi:MULTISPECIES: enterobactin transporter EntS [Chromobacterium]|uniref:Multidrug efflux pump Tap n=2 Tax=Chromobacterium TaxID=535 RepID=A0ABS3GQ71_9NEIS|nr:MULTISPECIES: enterobactin transporter EntS [Chromobacterium]AXT48896.1 enterobactin transporter EntS [Chromobacterium rhizoryzae]MBK0415865.1 enterobactin transporter EntS [Chromobacterium haemolyticum]MBO0417186.1 enterobactin transporter EntS [Chromobacterium haemolyticum]MBO0500266.1 enterobactin transporter EntS [Chromobacterium haemolyticum]OQS31979.1 MFS transporter [Chromobacterium haemolyticum]
MKKSPIFVDFSLLRLNPHFRSIFIARMISVFAFGILMVAVPVQIHQLTGSTLQVGAAMALDGVGMFAGLMCGGVLADRMDRRRLILLGRSLCGLGFLALALNGFMTHPSVLALYVVSAWDGFFSGIGITSLMASIPVLVGRENLPAAGALSMLTMRIGGVLSPLLGGLIIAAVGVNWNYLLAGVGTLATLIPLTRLPSLKPQGGEPAHPLRSLLEGFEFLWQNKVVGAVVAVGTLQTLLSAVRVLYPSLAEDGYGGGAFEVGLMYSAVPLGAMIGAFTSGWVGGLSRPGAVMLSCVLASSLSIASLGLVHHLAYGLLALALLGYFGSIASLLQFTLVQGNTPDHLLGRVNSLWNAQDVVGDGLGALGLGALARALAPLTAVAWFGAAAAAASLAMCGAFGSLRRLAGGAAAEAEAAGEPARQGAGS